MFPWFTPKSLLSRKEVEGGLRYVIYDGIATHALVSLTGGVFMVAFALQLGASNLMIGILAAIPPLVALVQIPAVWVINRVRNRRLICICTSTISRSLWLGIAALPFLFPPDIALLLFIVLIGLYSAISSIGGCSWSSWMRDLVPQERLGSFFSRRWSLALAVGIVISLAASAFVDGWKGQDPGSITTAYSAIFVAGVIVGYIGIGMLSRIPEPLLQRNQESSFVATFRRSMQGGNFRNLLIFLALWNFSVNLAAPFFTVYLFKNIGLSITGVIALSVFSQIVSIFSYPLWGKFIDRYSNKTALSLAGPLFMIAILGWTFTTMPGPYSLTIPLLVLLHAVMGLSTAGVTLSGGYIGMKLAPREVATAQLAVIGVVNSLVAGIAPALGGLFVDFFSARELTWTLTWMGPSTVYAIPTLSLQNWDFFFVVAFVIGLFSLHRLAYVQETGEIDREILVQELLTQVRRDMRNFSTIGGLRYMLHIPLSGGFTPEEEKMGIDRLSWVAA
ncbi:MAG TPA: MFS transporter [Methanomicrobiales archaeon]|nr:MFS transporter [Methanomicrobiales archaeon]